MAWTLVGSTTQIIENGNTEDVTLPGSPQTGDIVIFTMGADFNTCTLNTSGYTNLYSEGTTPVCTLDYKVMGETPDSVVNVTQEDGGATARDGAVVLQVWRGVDTGTPIDTLPITTAIDSSGNPDSPAYTPATNGALVFSIGLLDDDSVAASVTAPSGYSNLIAGESVPEASTTGYTGMIASKTLVTAAEENPGAFGSDGDDAWIAITFALRPAGGAPAVPILRRRLENY